MSQPPARPPLSPDGRWYWDGTGWRSLVSPDGRSIWNGSAWVPLEAAASDRPSWLPAESWTVVGPREAPSAEATPDPGASAVPAPPAPEAPAASAVPAPPAPEAPDRVRPVFRVRDLFTIERLVQVAIFLVAAIVAGQWWYFSR